MSTALHGKHYLGTETSAVSASSFRAIDPTSGAALEPGYSDATAEEVSRAVGLARSAQPSYAALEPAKRAAFLRAIASRLEALGDELLERAALETALPLPRLTGERGRTMGQLTMFADVVEEGSWVGARIDHAIPDRKPIPKPDLRRMLVPLGPVVVFGASNFPLAFSVAGGDTAAALAAGCTVVVKAHPMHPGTSELVARAILDAAHATEMPAGVFSMVHGVSHEVGKNLVMHADVTAVAFTGSFRGGRALYDLAASRETPIPVFAEMGSSNPVFVLPRALAERGETIASGLVQSVNLGVGQFCTNPGLSVMLAGDEASSLLAKAAEEMGECAAGTMVHPMIRSAYDSALDEVSAVPGVRALTDVKTSGEEAKTGQAHSALFAVAAEAYTSSERLQHEVYGPASIAVTCESKDEVLNVARSLHGHLTATVHGTEEDLAEYRDLVDILQTKVGRVVFNGFPTGVDVCPSMQHGGPYPATTDARTTSVGSAAIERFARPVAYQDAPEALLPNALREGNPLGILRLVDGVYEK